MRLILAIGLNGEMGINNEMPWGMNQKSDLKHFKEKTDGSVILMGRKTFESLGRVLPNRCHLVVTNNLYPIEGAMTVTSPEKAIEITEIQSSPVFLIGGKRLIDSMSKHIDEIHLTVIESEFEADKYFDMDILSGFELSQSDSHPSDEENSHPYRFEIWRRKI